VKRSISAERQLSLDSRLSPADTRAVRRAAADDEAAVDRAASVGVIPPASPRLLRLVAHLAQPPSPTVA